ncbi:MAG: peptide ABC transporter substrate-binding protein [Chloroflexota bacterium]
MKPDIRWQVLLVLAAVSLVLMLLSFQVQSAALCTTTIPSSGGTYIEGMVGSPLVLNPLLSDTYPIDRELTNLIFDGLVRFDETGQIQPALAEEWSISDDGLVISFKLRDDLVWHDGVPVTVEDVAFTFGLLQDPQFPGPAALVNLWRPITIQVVDRDQIEFTLPQPYAPFMAALTRGILPSHLLSSVAAAELAASAFNLAPVGTGPFRVETGQSWNRTGRMRLTPDPSYWREGTQLSDIEIRFYPSDAELLAAFEAGQIHGANGISPTTLPVLTEMEDTRVFTSAVPRYMSLLFNMTDSGAPAVQSIEARQALALGLDRSHLVDNVLNGQGLIFDGPYLPESWAYRPAILTPYAYDPQTAGSMLDGLGWIPDAEGIRQSSGTPLSIRLLTSAQSDQQAIADAIAAMWRDIGIDVQVMVESDLDDFRSDLSERNFDLALVEVAAPDDPDLYDFWSQEAIVRGQNYGGWNNRRASEALETARQLYSKDERAVYYEAFLRQFASDLPALTLYQSVNVMALHDSVQQVEIGRVWQPRDRFKTFPIWFLNFRDVVVACPLETSD